MALLSVPSATVRGIGDRAEQAMAEHVAEFEVLGPWSLETSRRFWEGFTPATLAGQPAGPGLRTVFCTEGDWHRAETEVTQAGATARLAVQATVTWRRPRRRRAGSCRSTLMRGAGQRWAAGTR
jgi:hypothetical protein